MLVWLVERSGSDGKKQLHLNLSFLVIGIYTEAVVELIGVLQQDVPGQQNTCDIQGT